MSTYIHSDFLFCFAIAVKLTYNHFNWPIRLDGVLKRLLWDERTSNILSLKEHFFFSCFNITSYHWTIHENHNTTHNYIEILFGSCEFKNHNKKHNLYAPCVTKTSMVNKQEQKMNKKRLPKHVPESMHQADEKKKQIFCVSSVVECVSLARLRKANKRRDRGKKRRIEHVSSISRCSAIKNHYLMCDCISEHFLCLSALCLVFFFSALSCSWPMPTI